MGYGVGHATEVHRGGYGLVFLPLFLGLKCHHLQRFKHRAQAGHGDLTKHLTGDARVAVGYLVCLL